jgi:hypothetical protein
MEIMEYDKNISDNVTQTGNILLLNIISLLYDVSVDVVKKYQRINGNLPNIIDIDKQQIVKNEFKLIERLLKIEKIKRNVQ